MYVEPLCCRTQIQHRAVIRERFVRYCKQEQFGQWWDASACVCPEFSKAQKLELLDCCRCPCCKDYWEYLQHLDLWRLPDLLTFHIRALHLFGTMAREEYNKSEFPIDWLGHE